MREASIDPRTTERVDREEDMATADCAGRRFAVACGVLSRCVKAGKTAAAMLLMPGTDEATAA
uniref:Uncharacterized protein n=1 Tax=Leersia perrieri TaxID=77586 RepID=A0A0D9XJA2_9ORYZ